MFFCDWIFGILFSEVAIFISVACISMEINLFIYELCKNSYQELWFVQWIKFQQKEIDGSEISSYLRTIPKCWINWLPRTREILYCNNLMIKSNFLDLRSFVFKYLGMIKIFRFDIESTISTIRKLTRCVVNRQNIYPDS